MDQHDRVIVVGGGVAGLATALRLSPMPVTLIMGGSLGTNCSTALAQGGIAAAMGPDDGPALHAADTLAAAAGLGDSLVAGRVTGAAPAAIDWLIGQGMRFDSGQAGLSFGLEAAHSRRRILHAGGDRTGQRLLETLIVAVRTTSTITLIENARVDALGQDDNGHVTGVHLRKAGRPGQIRPSFYPARAVVLATGGIGGLYAHTTNPLGNVGSGLLLAARAGAVLRDLEFVQFHPTAIAVGRDPMPLATEALRGEGARLVNGAGEYIMADVAGSDLAPRDVVAATLSAAIAKGEEIFLQLNAALARDLPRRFPEVAELCNANGVDLTQRRIPVRPAAHYHMGGIKVDGRGRSSIGGLWACGEVASAGLHGGNRLASNSLIEALVYARWIAEDVQSIAASVSRGGSSAPRENMNPSAQASRSAPAAHWLRTLMDSRLGVTRHAAPLAAAIEELAPAAFSTDDGADHAMTALMMAISALSRQESRGAHRRTDYPATAPVARATEMILQTAIAHAKEIVGTQRRPLEEAS